MGITQILSAVLESLIRTILKTPNGIVIKTVNSAYLVDSTDIFDIPSAAIDNIRNGTPPAKAVDIVNGSLFKTVK
jgi:hypothetical protein